MRFTEVLDHRLSTAALYDVGTGKRVSAAVTARGPQRLVLTPSAPLRTAAYRVEWHSVAADDGHALEGSFAFGVRAPAVGGTRSTQHGPLTGAGWLRALVRALFYASLFTFAGALMLAVLVQRGERLWLIPAALDTVVSAGGQDQIVRRYRSIVVDSGLLSAGLASTSALLDAANAAGGISLPSIRDYLLHNHGGIGRVAVAGFIALALAAAQRFRRLAAICVALSLGAMAIAGHADAASPHRLAILTDWIHLLAGAVWLGGIALIVLTWAPSLRGPGRALRTAVAGHVLPRFGSVALPAFAIVVITGTLNAVIELGRVAALWDTAYGRTLLVKIALVGLIAAASFVHAFRLRPQIITNEPRPELERRHWRLLGSEPLLGVAVALTVALLVAFPPPHNATSASARDVTALTAPCDPCPLPAAKPDELAVAEQGGSNVVAAWIRRGPHHLTGQVRLIDKYGHPSSTPFEIAAAQTVTVSCGIGCRRFSTSSAGPPPPVLRVNVVERGHEYAAILPARWRPGDTARARALLIQAQATMRRLRAVRQDERVQTLPGLTAVTAYRLKAPNKFAYVNAVRRGRATHIQGESIVIGKTQWFRTPGTTWRRESFGGGLAFRTRSWFTWTSYAQAVRLLDVRRERGRRIAVLALADPGTPAWWRLYVDLESRRVVRDRLITKAHFMTQRYSAFNAPLRIVAPSRTGP